MTREQAGQSEGISTMCPLVFCIDTCLPHILDHFISFQKRWVFREATNPPRASALNPAETKGARTRGGNVTSSQLRQASGSCPEPRTCEAVGLSHGWGVETPNGLQHIIDVIIRKEKVIRM